MPIVSLETAKTHMKVDDSAEDELIELYIEAAEQWAGNYIGSPITNLNPVTADVKLAILRLASFYYEHRNIATFGLSVQMAPHGVVAILDSYRKNWFTDGE